MNKRSPVVLKGSFKLAPFTGELVEDAVERSQGLLVCTSSDGKHRLILGRTGNGITRSRPGLLTEANLIATKTDLGHIR